MVFPPSQPLVDKAVAHLRPHVPAAPLAAVVLGSGFGAYADRPPVLAAIPYRDIPGFPPCAVEGHAGRLVLTRRGRGTVAILQGRVHRYEGYPLEVVTRPLRVLAALGVQTVVLTCAAGALAEWEDGTCMAIEDHLNLMGDNPLRGDPPGGQGFGGFVEMAGAYDRSLLEVATRAAESVGLPLKRGVLAAVAGPTYETAAEAAMIGRLGAHAVSMSVVPEAIVARSLGLRVLGLALITNRSGAALDHRLGHHQVVAVAERRMAVVGAWLDAVLSEVS